MQTRIVVLLLVLSVMPLTGQIINGGFEVWDTTIGIELPAGWKFGYPWPQTSRISRDSVRVDGSYSLKISNLFGSSWYLCDNKLRTVGEFTCQPRIQQSLFFWVKAIPDDPEYKPTIEVHGCFFDKGTCNDFEWKNEGFPYEFTEIEIPIPLQSFDSIFIELKAGSQWGIADQCFGKSTTWFDGFEVRASSIQEDSPFIFPNPTDGTVFLGSLAHGYTRYEVYDLLGRSIDRGDISENMITLRQPGLFVLMLSGSCDGRDRVGVKAMVRKT